MEASDKPRALFALAVLFLLAPFISFLVGFQLIRLFDQPELGFASYLSSLTVLEWSWAFLLVLAGGLLLLRHKTAWLFAMITLFAAIALTVTMLLDAESGQTQIGETPLMILAVLLCIGVLLVMYYARYPYLDRRQGWVRPLAQRFDVAVPVRLVGDEIYLGTTESISQSGCRVRLPKDWGRADRLRFVEVAFPDCAGVRLKAQIVAVEGPILRLKFREFILGQKAEFDQWMQSLTQTKA